MRRSATIKGVLQVTDRHRGHGGGGRPRLAGVGRRPQQGPVIEPFSVPPDMASRGLTGEVVAGQMLDKLTAHDQVEILPCGSELCQ